MPRSNARRRAATVAAVIGLALSSSIPTAPPQAAPKLTWEKTSYKKMIMDSGTRGFQLYHDRSNIGAIRWSADPLLGSWTGDSFYV